MFSFSVINLEPNEMKSRKSGHMQALCARRDDINLPD